MSRTHLAAKTLPAIPKGAPIGEDRTQERTALRLLLEERKPSITSRDSRDVMNCALTNYRTWVSEVQLPVALSASRLPPTHYYRYHTGSYLEHDAN